LKKLPDAERPAEISLRSVLRDTPRHLFAASASRNYVWLAVCHAVISTPIPPFVAYYLKVGPRLTSGQIMLFEVFRYAGVMTAAWLIRKRIDKSGAKPFFLLAFGIYAVVGTYWWFYLENGFGGTPGIYAIFFLLGLGAATWAVSNLSYLPRTMASEERTLAVTVHGAVTAFIGGLSPMIWGLFLRAGDGAARAIDTVVFQWFFVSVTVGALLLLACFTRLAEDRKTPVEPILIGYGVLRPFRGVSYLVNLIDPRKLRRGGQPEGRSDDRK
ncbi:MAG: hypothetical protein WD941_08535, partial [Opitutus sp.]